MSAISLPTRRFGVEFEVGNEKHIVAIATTIRAFSNHPVTTSLRWRQTANNDYWHVKFDRTCGPIGLVGLEYIDHGWEVASFIASGDQDLEHIASIAYILQEVSKCSVNANCGFHIHCDVADFTPAQMGVLLARWIKIEPLLCQMVPEHRVNNRFCRQLGSRKVPKRRRYLPSELWDQLKPTNYYPHENVQKKVTLNTVNYAAALHTEMTFHQEVPHQADRKTVEFRLPEGTLDRDTVRGWVQFFVRFVETSKHAEMPKNLLKINKITHLFKYCGISSDNKDIGAIKAKLFMLERLRKYAKVEVKN